MKPSLMQTTGSREIVTYRLPYNLPLVPSTIRTQQEASEYGNLRNNKRVATSLPRVFPDLSHWQIYNSNPCILSI